MNPHQRYSILCGELADSLSVLKKIDEQYLNRFPNDFSRGLFCSHPLKKKTLLEDYGIYVKQTLEPIETTDKILYSFSTLMADADSAFDEETVCRMDRLLISYRQFLCNRQCELQTIEAVLQTKADQTDAIPIFQAAKKLHSETLRMIALCIQEQAKI